MRKEATVLLAVAFAIVLAFVVIQVPGAQPAEVKPRVVVAMTSHEVARAGTTATGVRTYRHFFRIWSDGYTEWNCHHLRRHSTQFPFHQNWSGWKSIDADTDHICD